MLLSRRRLLLRPGEEAEADRLFYHETHQGVQLRPASPKHRPHRVEYVCLLWIEFA